MASSTSNPTTTVNIQGLDKVELLLALWEKQVLSGGSRTRIARGFPAPTITREKALAALTEEGGYVESLCGKWIETDFSSNVVKCDDYDHHVEAGTMARVVENLHAPVLHATLNAVRQRRLQEVFSIKTVTPDGACFWRCLLNGLPDNVCRLLDLPSTTDFANGSAADVFPHVNKLRTMTAETVKLLHTGNSREWRDILECIPREEREEAWLEAWMDRMKTPIESLIGDRRYADDLAIAGTSQMFRKLGVPIRINITTWIYTNEAGDEVRRKAKCDPGMSSMDINLAYLIHEHGRGYHFDRVINEAADRSSQENTR
jgi:hypothetical protein